MLYLNKLRCGGSVMHSLSLSLKYQIFIIKNDKIYYN